MTTAVQAKQRWDSGTYGEIVSARFEQSDLALAFADGTRTTIPLDRLRSPHLVGADWSRLRFTADEIVVPTTSGDVEISWFTLRALSDAEFAAYLDEFAAAETTGPGSSSNHATDAP